MEGQMATIYSSSELPKEYECPIDMELMEDPVLAKCTHTFDRSNIEKWLEKHSSCPICRKPIDRTDLVANRVLKDLIQSFIKSQKSVPISDNPLPKKDSPISNKVQEYLKDFIEPQKPKEILNDLSKQNEGTISIFIHISIPHQKTNISLKIFPDDTVGDVIKKIHKKNPTFWGLLLDNGKRLRNENKIKDYKIKDGSHLSLIRPMQVFCRTAPGVPTLTIEVLPEYTFKEVGEEIRIRAKERGYNLDAYVVNRFCKLIYSGHLMKKTNQTLANLGIKDESTIDFII